MKLWQIGGSRKQMERGEGRHTDAFDFIKEGKDSWSGLFIGKTSL